MDGLNGLDGVGMNRCLRGVVVSFVKQNWFRQAGKDLWHLDRDYFCNHFWKADFCGQGPGLDKEVKGELVQLLNNLGEGEKEREKEGKGETRIRK